MGSEEIDDSQLISSTLNGDGSAFGILIRRHEQKVAATCIGILGRTPEAEDVGQEVFIKLYDKLSSFRGEAALGTYLTRMAINMSLNALKKRKRNRAESLDQRDYSHLSDGVDHAAHLSHEDTVERALASLDDPQRAVVVLRMLQGYSTKETAEILSIPLGTVLSRLARAQEKLKNLIYGKNG